MVQQRPCTEGANIQWVFKGHKLRLKAQMEKCLDVPNHKFQNGAMLQVYDCDLGGEDQRLVNPMVLGRPTDFSGPIPNLASTSLTSAMRLPNCGTRCKFGKDQRAVSCSMLKDHRSKLDLAQPQFP